MFTLRSVVALVGNLTALLRTSKLSSARHSGLKPVAQL
jgi:hypothetical protein